MKIILDSKSFLDACFRRSQRKVGEGESRERKHLQTYHLSFFAVARFFAWPKHFFALKHNGNPCSTAKRKWVLGWHKSKISNLKISLDGRTTATWNLKSAAHVRKGLILQHNASRGGLLSYSSCMREHFGWEIDIDGLWARHSIKHFY